MMKLFDEKTGYLLLDEFVMNRASFQRMMEDSVITDSEVISHAQTVIQLFRQLDEKLDEEEKELVTEAISELAVLYQINAMKEGK